MGIIVTDELELENGMTLTNSYVNVDNINIKKSNIPDCKYCINADGQFYVNKLTRESSHNRTIQLRPLGISSNVLTNVEEQLYTYLKTKYTSYTDDI